MRRHLQAFLMLSLSLLALVPQAQAGGLEYAGGGTTALGRGGANAARADTPMVLRNNPAGLAELRGDQLMLNLDYARMSACVTPYGYYGWGGAGRYGDATLTDPKTGEQQVLNLSGEEFGGTMGDAAAEAYYVDPLDKVCLDQQHTPIPQLAFTMRLTEDLGFGAGVIFPAVTPQGTWGSSTGIIRGDTGDLRPAATRYMLVQSSNLGIFPTVGLGYRLADWFRIGAAVEWGMFAISNTVVTPIESGTSPHNDVLARVSAEDFFVPALTASVHLVPTDALDIVAGARFQDDVDATGRLTATTGLYNADLVPYDNKGLGIQSLNQAMPWKFWAGVRFADRLRDRPTGTGHDEGEQSPGAEPVHDAFNDEQWDVEFDVVYEMNSRVKAQDVDFDEGQVIRLPTAAGGESTVPFPDTDTPPTYIQKNWKDQLSLRVGGSYNFIPGVFGVSVGAHYENRGIDPNFMNIDFFPVERVGLHAGVTVRLIGSVDVSLAYAHIFQETITVAPQANDPTSVNGQDKRVGLAAGRGAQARVLEEDPVTDADGVAMLRQNATKAPNAPVFVNAGKYVSSIDVLSLGVQMHF